MPLIDQIHDFVTWALTWGAVVLGGLLAILAMTVGGIWIMDAICRRLQTTWRFAVYLMNIDKINSMIMQLPNGEYRKWARRDLPVRIEEVVKERDTAYTDRVRLLAVLALVYDAALVRDERATSAEWEWVLLIQFPTGQGSWHIKESDLPLLSRVQRSPGGHTLPWKWDGHSTEEKNLRLKALVDEE